jgi:hypothetical protein
MAEQPPPPRPQWVILGRVIRVAPEEELQAAEEEHNAQYQHAVLEMEGVEAEEEPDFTLSVVRPPRVTIVEAGLGAQPVPDFPDTYP